MVTTLKPLPAFIEVRALTKPPPTRRGQFAGFSVQPDSTPDLRAQKPERDGNRASPRCRNFVGEPLAETLHASEHRENRTIARLLPAHAGRFGLHPRRAFDFAPD